MAIDSLKKLVVYYSFEGNTRFIANVIASSIRADLLELKPVKELSSKGFTKYFWGGRQVIFRKKPDLLPLELDPEKYDLIFIGTPVWVFTYSPVLRTFFSQVLLKNKKIAFFCCHEGGMKSTLNNMERALPGNTIVGKIDFYKPLAGDKEADEKKAKEWAVRILSLNE